jgi:exodeoxyribonuclease V beta subunit
MKLRLESDEALVRVVTIHKSKGLEYPLVFLPFIAAARPLDASRLPYRYHNDEGELQLCYQQDDVIFAKAERERLGEDLRKLYVALTRARHYCWLGLAPLKEPSAIAYLLDAGALLPAGSIKDLLVRWTHPAISAEAWQAPAQRLSFDDQQQHSSLPEQPYARMAKRSYLPWWTASYSALAAGAGTASDHLLLPGTGDGFDKAKNAELYQELAKEPLNQTGVTELFTLEHKLRAEADNGTLDTVPPQISIVVPEATAAMDISQQFLRGASAGTFLHDVLEWAANIGFAELLQQPDLLTQQLQSACQNQHWLWQDSRSSRWQRRLLVTDALELPEFETAQAALAPLQQWLIHLLQARWQCDGQTIALCTLELYQPELEFWFAASSVQTKQLDLLLQQYLWPQQPRPALQPQLVNGMLKGFIDLTFCLDGRYHVSDYKSNYIATGHYSTEALQQLMLEKRYDLQAALYGLALHRLLLSRLPDYDISLHLGQAYYWFVRACPLARDLMADVNNANQTKETHNVSTDNNAGVLCCPLPPALILALDALFSGKAVLLPEEIL